ncbi:hypothetical protein DFH06DRAFT_1186971, partial [Mycena polygramma]
AASQVGSSELSLGDERFFLDLETFRLVVPVPDITWGAVAQMCEHAINPMYKGLYSILEKDMENVAQILAALELDSEQIEHSPSMLSGDLSIQDAIPVPCTEALSADPLIIRNHMPSVPTIVITPCPPQSRDIASFCQVPYQDNAFRNQLTVPSLPSFNLAFPPMVPLRRLPARAIKHWIWKDGHWQAVLNGLEPRPRVHKQRKTRRTTSVKSVAG